MVSGIENRFFEGAGNQGKNPKYSLTDLDEENFRLVKYFFSTLLSFICKEFTETFSTLHTELLVK